MKSKLLMHTPVQAMRFGREAFLSAQESSRKKEKVSKENDADPETAMCKRREKGGLPAQNSGQRLAISESVCERDCPKAGPMRWGGWGGGLVQSIRAWRSGRGARASYIC